MAPPDQDSRTAFIVTPEVIETGNVMKHVREGVLNGISGIRNEQRLRIRVVRLRAVTASAE